MSIPEPKSFNGGPEDQPAFAPSGRRRTEDDVLVRPEPAPICCRECGVEVIEIHSGAGLGVFCSHRCRVRLRNRKGGDPAEWPEDLRVREFPATSPGVHGPA